MSIRSRLALTFILLLVFGITAISSYSILFIRNYLLEEGERQIESDSHWLSLTIRNLPVDHFETRLNEAALISGYRIGVYDSDGILFASVPYDEAYKAPPYLEQDLQETLETTGGTVRGDGSDSEWLSSFVAINGESNPARFLHLSQLKDEIYAPIHTIRWIIYTGMFISMGLILLVSFWFARYISRPIVQLEETARAIAEGDVDKTLHLNRKDEFGTLAESLNRMASRLRQDNQELKRLYEKQSQFFEDITHELRNPLHTIAGALEMLQMESLPEPQRGHYVQTALKQTERINRLFKDLVTLQRYDSDSYFIETKDFNLGAVLVQASEPYVSLAREKGIRLEVESEAYRVKGDPNKIEQVLDNLVSNAVKYTNQGEIRIVSRRDGQNVRVEVSDTGIGISSEHLERLFDRFYRTDKARSRDKGGTGLGLAVVRGILAAHNTEIDVRSRVGEGTTFSFTLPLARLDLSTASG